MIEELQRRVARDLRDRGYPMPVVYGPEYFERAGGVTQAIVFARDRDSTDQIRPPLQTQQSASRSEVPFNRAVAGVVTIWAKSSLSGATVGDHECEVDLVADGVLSAMNRVLKVARLPLEIRESKILSDSDMQKIDASGWDGAACRIRFAVVSAVVDRRYHGSGPSTGVVFDVAQPTLDFPTGFLPTSLGARVVSWGDPNQESAGSTPDLVAGGVWTSATPPSTTTVLGQKVLVLNGTSQYIRKDTSSIPSNLGAGIGVWVHLTAADATELLFDAGTASFRVFRSTTTTFIRAVGTWTDPNDVESGPQATSQDFRFPNTNLDGAWHFLYIGIRGDDSIVLIDGDTPSGLSTVNNSGVDHFPESLGTFSTNTTIGADVGSVNWAQMMLGQFYGFVGQPLNVGQVNNLASFMSLAGA